MVALAERVHLLRLDLARVLMAEIRLEQQEVERLVVALVQMQRAARELVYSAIKASVMLELEPSEVTVERMQRAVQGLVHLETRASVMQVQEPLAKEDSRALIVERAQEQLEAIRLETLEVGHSGVERELMLVQVPEI